MKYTIIDFSRTECKIGLTRETEVGSIYDPQVAGVGHYILT